MSEFKTASTEAMDEFEALESSIVNWRPMVFVEGQWAGNALVFATKAEAEASAEDLMYRWTSVSDSRASETNEPVNYRWINGKLEQIGPTEAKWI